ncbi:IclR family transcriptional regulator [Sinomonas atrocyanea]|uniref:IclR family transcriptional regulator n=1 Tax=Sinomonas atrocyanea TaxID=37927 RepID=A0A127A6U0_9MICC|nr:IclR family transcriptional regulator C-terminal domain-containing protein [Sinomonas atrocyanea]AMM34504.1 IclR family transcriptional regulator [Sinomonas atrocyanea]GEB66612.1 IclR family transcriptional regulator [Sinomonas atrocyanea]GGG67863.1 IclR family transcriptional regulator [Sinomonas atrocyanea]
MNGGGPSTVTNSLRILEIVARFGTGTTAKEITDSLQIPPATAYRVLNALVGDEYLARTSDLRGFALGHAISGLITAAAPPTVPTAARRLIEEFRSGNRFAVHLIMFRNASLRIADEDPDYPLQSAFNLLRYPHASAAGKLMLAHLDDLASTLPRGHLQKLTPNTITDKRRLSEILEEIRTKGEATEISELEEGSSRLALPVCLPDGSAGAALCLSAPAERFTALREQAGAAREVATQLAPFLF